MTETVAKHWEKLTVWEMSGALMQNNADCQAGFFLIEIKGKAWMFSYQAGV